MHTPDITPPHVSLDKFLKGYTYTTQSEHDPSITAIITVLDRKPLPKKNPLWDDVTDVLVVKFEAVRGGKVLTRSQREILVHHKYDLISYGEEIWLGRWFDEKDETFRPVYFWTPRSARKAEIEAVDKPEIAAIAVKTTEATPNAPKGLPPLRVLRVLIPSKTKKTA